MAKKKSSSICSFCGRPEDAVQLLITGETGNICNLCTDQAQQMVAAQLAEKPLKKNNWEIESQIKLLKPKDIKEKLDEYVIGQDDAKKVMSVAVYNHYKRILFDNKEDEVELEKSNILMVGDTGTGKTLLAKTLARVLQVPFCIADATVLTEAGYVGEDVESIISRLLQAADYKPELAERGIIYVDEIDKIARKSDNPSITRDVSGEGVQQGLLKILEGTVANIAPKGGRKHPDQNYVQVDTKNILFICGGAFEGINKIIERRISSQSLGFQPNDKKRSTGKNILSALSPMDLRSFGLIPEIIGRLPIHTHLNPLDKKTLKSILTDPKNAIIKQYKKLFELEDIKLNFSDEVIDYIVDKAIEMDLGARGLRSICESIMLDYMYDAPSNKSKSISVNKKDIENAIKKMDFQAA
jgi:ATP-dependent Clp protease ATP-binding subunit ClpX